MIIIVNLTNFFESEKFIFKLLGTTGDCYSNFNLAVTLVILNEICENYA